MLAGVYSIVDRGDNTRLDYELEIPLEPKQVQQEFCIGKTADYVISIKARTVPLPQDG